MPYLTSHLSPDPLFGQSPCDLGGGWWGLDLHPHAVPWRGAGGAGTIDSWAAKLNLHREPPLLAADPMPSDELDLVLDFGAEMEAELELILTTAGDATVAVTFGESDWEARDWGTPSTCAAQRPRKAHWRIATAGTHERRFESGGWRYVRIRVADHTGTICLRAVAHARFSAPGRLGDVQCDDPSFQRVWQASLYTALLCTRPDAIWDGIKRDRVGWYGDARICQDSVDWAYDLPAPALEMMRSLPVGQWANEIPNYSFDALAMLRRNLERYGATEAARDTWPRVVDFMNWVRSSQLDSDGLITRRDGIALQFGIGFLDWSEQPIGCRLDQLFCLQASWIECLHNAARCAGWMNDRHDFLERLHRPLARIALGIAQLRPKRDRPAKTVKRQIAITAVISMKEDSLLRSVQRVVGRVKIQNDFPTPARDRFDSLLNEQPLNLPGLGQYLLVATITPERAEFHPVQCRVPRQRLSFGRLANPILSEHVLLPGHQRAERIIPQPILVVEIFVAQRQRLNPLIDQFLHAVFHQWLKTMIRKTSRQPVQRPSLELDLPNEEQSSVAAQMAPAKIHRHFPPQMGLKFKSFLPTVCHSEVGFIVCRNTLNISMLCANFTTFFVSV